MLEERNLPETMGDSIKLDQVGEDKDPSAKDELVFPGGPTYEMLERWKSQYNGEIYLTEFDDDVMFIWRPLRRKEYKDITNIKNADQFYKEERVCEKCVLFPERYGHMDMTHGKAGIPSLLYELIFEKSGFVAKTGSMRLS